MRKVMKPILLLAALVVAPAMAQNAAAPNTGASRWSMLDTYCTECHNATDWAGGWLSTP